MLNIIVDHSIGRLKIYTEEYGILTSKQLIYAHLLAEWAGAKIAAPPPETADGKIYREAEFVVYCKKEIFPKGGTRYEKTVRPAAGADAAAHGLRQERGKPRARSAARTLRAGGGGYFPCGAERGVRGRLAGHRAADEAQGGIPRCISKGSRGV